MRAPLEPLGVQNGKTSNRPHQATVPWWPGNAGPARRSSARTARRQHRAVRQGVQRRYPRQGGLVIPVVISVYKDRTFSFIMKSPPAAVLLKKAAGLAKRRTHREARSSARSLGPGP